MTLEKNHIVDLHMHTKFSDGGCELQELFDKLYESNVKVASITDHTSIEAYKHLENVDKHGIKLIKGIEIDVSYENTTFHVLMYNFKESALFKEYLNNVREHEIKNFLKMIDDLEKTFTLKFNQEQLDNFISNNTYLDKVRLNNFLTEIGLVDHPANAFYKYTKDIVEGTRYNISIKNFFAIAKETGATTSLAHPMKYLKTLETFDNLKNAILFLKENGLDAVEVYNNRQTEEQEQDLLNFVKQNNLQITGGSDAHFKFGSEEKKLLGTALTKPILLKNLAVDFLYQKEISN